LTFSHPQKTKISPIKNPLGGLGGREKRVGGEEKEGPFVAGHTKNTPPGAPRGSGGATFGGEKTKIPSGGGGRKMGGGAGPPSGGAAQSMWNLGVV